jgi:sigma-B regulation protein RsbU (phosphoserine phosphatase)
MIYGVLDLSNRSFTYVRAGHNPILFKKADDSIEWLQPVGVGVGMANEKNFDKVFQEDEIILHQGDVLILYTDGITEAQNEEKEFYDEKRLQQLIITEKMKSAKELRDLIIEDVRTFAGSSQQSDDMTLVVIKG